MINQARSVSTGNPASFAWAGLRGFQNVELVTKRIVELHKVPKKFHGDARKQAQQLRYCLIQAREYFNAAAAVSSATKPNLLYYGTMSLALAEILFKQSGDSSLDKAREENRHHGLTMTIGYISKGADLRAAGNAIRARPIDVSGVRRGTFELWHRSSREHPISGSVTQRHQNGGAAVGHQVIFTVVDLPFSPLPDSG
jgi:hypothetical protein